MNDSYAWCDAVSMPGIIKMLTSTCVRHGVIGDAPDLVQEAIARAHRRITILRQAAIRSGPGLCAKILHGLIVDYFRKRRELLLSNDALDSIPHPPLLGQNDGVMDTLYADGLRQYSMRSLFRVFHGTMQRQLLWHLLVLREPLKVAAARMSVRVADLNRIARAMAARLGARTWRPFT